MIRRIFVENNECDIKALLLKRELVDFLGEDYPEIGALLDLRLLRRFDISIPNEALENAPEEALFKRLVEELFEARLNQVFISQDPPVKKGESFFGLEFLPGQFDESADSLEQCAELIIGHKPRIRTADFFVFKGSSGTALSGKSIAALKKYLINPMNSREASPELPLSLEAEERIVQDIPVLTGFILEKDLKKLAEKYGLAMSIEDLLFCQDWFKGEGRDPTITELRMLDTYWSDHCRHTTFNTSLEEIKFDKETENNTQDSSSLKKALDLYEKTREEVYGKNSRKRSLMDMATIAAKAMKKRGLLGDLDESPEVNACTIKVEAAFADGSSEAWLLLFKNETHNHPTEIEPIGGAATCLGGAIRDPLSGRAYVHQAMRITGGADPRTRLRDVLPGKLPQIKLARDAAFGYSSYGNQIGVAAGQAVEFYHQGFLAKRMEMGAVIGAVPEAWVCREEPQPGDVVILTGGKTGRDGIGGATGSSKGVTENNEDAGPQGLVPIGNAAEERKIQRLFRKASVSRLIKRCNDFGAGGVSVAVSEIAKGLDINLDAVPPKYPGLDGTELAISESQERMAVVVAAKDADTFIKAAREENLEAVIIARVNADSRDKDARLRMSWRGKTIVDLSREFLDSNGAPRKSRVLLKSIEEQKAEKAPGSGEKTELASAKNEISAGVLLDKLERELASLKSGSRRGLSEMFDGSIGAASVLFPWGGSEQGTPECGMAALLPSLDKQSLTANLMTFGYDPFLMSLDTYMGAKGSVLEALAKYACLGGDPFKARLSFQEYFEQPNTPETWGLPAAALLGALEAQLMLGIPAIGGKDSMSGSYSDPANGIDIKVPPSLVAFAAGTVAANKILSGALSGKEGNSIILLSQSPAADKEATHEHNEWEIFKKNMKTLKALAESGALKAAYPVEAGGVALTMALMAFGNAVGVEAYADAFSRVDSVYYQGSLLAEIDEASLPDNFFTEKTKPWILAGRTLGKGENGPNSQGEALFRIVRPLPGTALREEENPEALSAQIALEVLRRAYEYPLNEIYPQTSTGATVAETLPEASGPANMSAKMPAYKGTSPSPNVSASRSSSPLVLVPVFPGNNGEEDIARAFREAGGRTELVIFKNKSREDIEDSIKELMAGFKKAQIIAFSGGTSLALGKFAENVLRLPDISCGITEFLEKPESLILGINDGFKLLINTGLLPYGRIVEAGELKISLALNKLGRHVSRMARTRVMPNNSPWLGLEEEDAIHVVPVSHSHGRLICPQEEAEKLFAAGQVPFCYADALGNPAMAEPDNPNGSAFAIEALSSPDGRILGKMANSERYGDYVHINIPGNKRQNIFKAGLNFAAGQQKG